MKNSFVFKPSDSQYGTRLDKALGEHPEIQSRSRAAKLIDLGLVCLNDKSVKSSHKIQANETFEVTLPEQQDQTKIKPYNFPLDIVFEDDDLLVVNKPAGLVVHPAAGHESDTLVNALVHHCDTLAMGFGEGRPGIVHRIDKDTSGLLVVAKNDSTQSFLAQQFKEKTAHRVYWALVFGAFKEPEGTIRSHLKRSPGDRKKFSSDRDEDPTGKLAITHYKVIDTHASGISLVHCQLETGRTHQIRIHMSEAGHPILGDTVYGSSGRLKNLKSVQLRKTIGNLNRHCLHAAELGFVHPSTKTKMLFKAEWPEGLRSIIGTLGFE